MFLETPHVSCYQRFVFFHLQQTTDSADEAAAAAEAEAAAAASAPRRHTIGCSAT